jgi:hypothetical protein
MSRGGGRSHGPVTGQVGAPGAHDAQIDTDLVAAAHRPQIPAHAGLVGDDRGVFRVRFAVTAVRR